MKKPPKNTPPWKKKPPKTAKHSKLTSAEIDKAKARAEKAGRRYPNLVDNMAVLRALRKKEAY